MRGLSAAHSVSDVCREGGTARTVDLPAYKEHRERRGRSSGPLFRRRPVCLTEVTVQEGRPRGVEWTDGVYGDTGVGHPPEKAGGSECVIFADGNDGVGRSLTEEEGAGRYG